MSPFSGDPRLHEEFSRIREDALARRAEIRRKLGPLPRQPGLRSRTASFLRFAADRLAPKPSPRTTPDFLPSTGRNSTTD
jgi:hypothetical protein